MNAFMRFAKAMSEQLFESRGEDLMNETLCHEDQYGDNQVISQEYIDTVLYDPVHSEAIKERIRLAVLADVQAHPDDYDMCGDDYVYSGDIYDYAYLVDHYVQEQYPKDNPEFHTRHICSECGSDNVQVKSWTLPNQNHKFVDEVNQGDEPGFCNDCQQHVYVDTAEVNVRHKVIGFQIVMADDTTEDSPVVYDLTFCLDTLRDNPKYKLKAAWSGDVLEPTLMFEGDPRNPIQKSKH